MTEMPWWQSAVIYQIYPRSFQDTDGDGVGDLRGIIQRLPHLIELGIHAIWIAPVFRSPMADFGYDVSDYIDIDPLFGSMNDFDELLVAAHRSGLKVLLDLVPNHTSDQHPWFLESRSSRQNPKRGWYLWHDSGPDGGSPNNWMSEFGGSAWEFDSPTGQYYYHAFLARQPDLNWRNPQVRGAIYDVMRFWLRRGVDGFRVDVLWHLIKDDQFRDNPANPNFVPGRPPHEGLRPLYTTDRPEMRGVVAEMRSIIDEFKDRLLIGEIYLPLERLVAYYGADLRGAHLPFNFTLLSAPWNAATIGKLIDEYEAVLPAGGWPNWVLGNHDRPRIASRVGREQARVAAMLLLTLRGTPTIYYGDEIGMVDVAISPDQVRDPLEKNVPGIGVGRDGCRTPMQWNAEANAGFSTGTPWLPLAVDARTQSVEDQRLDPASMYNLYRQLIRLRRSHDALLRGSYHPVAANGDLLAFVRSDDHGRILVALNFGSRLLSVPTRGLAGTLLLSSDPKRQGDSVADTLVLQPNEGVVIELAGST
jgi:alpha-glucosidase